MITDLKHYIHHLPSFIDEQTCDKTVREMNNISFREHQFYNPVTKNYAPRSGSQELSMSWDEVTTKKFIQKRLWNAIASYIEFIDVPWFSSWSGYTHIRFNKYAENKKMALHCDHIHSMFEGEKKGIPILSVLGTLNDDYEGGEFIMFDDYEIKFKKGDVIIFPSIFLYPHKVEPVTKGTRYSYISWVW